MKKSLSPKDTHGPVVQTGPTAGQNRSRNSNGQWRKKRSDAGVPRKFCEPTEETYLIDDMLTLLGLSN
jgi:hypothetical protein